MSALGNLVKGPVNTALDKAQKAAPAQLDAAATSAGLALTGSVTKATAVFTRLYTEATTSVAAWLPTIKPWLLVQLAKAVTGAKKYVATL